MNGKWIWLCWSLWLAPGWAVETLQVVTEDYAPYNYLEEAEIKGLGTEVVEAMLEEAGFSVAHTAILPDEMEQISAELLDLPEVQKQHRQIAEEHKDEYLHITCGLFAEDCTGLRG